MAGVAAPRPAARPDEANCPAARRLQATGSTATPGATSSSPFPMSGCCCSSWCPSSSFLHELRRIGHRPAACHWSDELALCRSVKTLPGLFTNNSISGPISTRFAMRGIATFFCLLIGYPMALGIARAQRRLAQYPAAAGHPAVLDLVPAARLCLDRAAGKQQLVQSRPHLALQHLPSASGARSTRPDDEHQFRRRSSASSIPTCPS